jgi:transposase
LQGNGCSIDPKSDGIWTVQTDLQQIYPKSDRLLIFSVSQPGLIHIKTLAFTAVNTVKNQELKRAGLDKELLLAWRTTGEYWGKERTVVVTYNPKTARKQRYNFESKLLMLEEFFYSVRQKVRNQEPQWKSKTKVEKRYLEYCEALHLPKDLYDLDLEEQADRLTIRFRKSYHRIGKHCERFGKNIIITDNMDWETEQIIQASLDRYLVEKSFRCSKDDDLVSMAPVRH